MSARRAWLASMLVLAAIAAAACTVPTDDEARPIDPARLLSPSNKINCTAAGVGVQTATVQVYLVSQQRELPFVESVDRIITNTPPTPYDALNALLNCLVTEEDRRRGLATAVPEDTQLLGLDPAPDQPGFFEVRLGPLPNRGAQKADDLDKVAVAQIFFTVTGPGLTEQVRGLRFSIAGNAVAVNTDKRTVGRGQFVERADFIASAPPTTTASPSTRTPTTSTLAPTTTRAG